MRDHVDEFDAVVAAQVGRLDAVQLCVCPVQTPQVVVDRQSVWPACN